jgi:hypothetical protein
MHGQISLESTLGSGTTAMFSIPFNKPQFQGAGCPFVDASALPDRLQSELSLSCNTSSKEDVCVTPPITSPLDRPSKLKSDKQMSATDIALQKTMSPVTTPTKAGEIDRSKIQVLVVEDKYVHSLRL